MFEVSHTQHSLSLADTYVKGSHVTLHRSKQTAKTENEVTTDS